MSIMRIGLCLSPAVQGLPQYETGILAAIGLVGTHSRCNQSPVVISVI